MAEHALNVRMLDQSGRARQLVPCTDLGRLATLRADDPFHVISRRLNRFVMTGSCTERAYAGLEAHRGDNPEVSPASP
jgi:hypothetical protein